MKTILHVVGARPNFMKTAPIMAALAGRPDRFRQLLVHTGQHYDYKLSRVFFEELDLPDPDEFLDVGSGSHAEQTARVLLAFEGALLRHRPDRVVVVGDVNSTLACALACAKLGVPLAHVEAGLRSGDRSMPEEINRLVTDRLADLLLTPSPDADANLLAEGVPAEQICCVGNVMIDTLVRMLPHAARRPTLAELGLSPGSYALATLHRPSNVDEPGALAAIMGALERIAGRLPVLFPVHPRTRRRLDDLEFRPRVAGLRLIEPLGYLDFLALQHGAALAITDSGGVQEETTFLGVPCLTLRPNTERPITVSAGTNRLVTGGPAALPDAAELALDDPPPARCPGLWDGRAAERIAGALLERL